MEGVGLALRSLIARVKDATAKRSSVSVEVRIKYKILSLEPELDLSECFFLNLLLLSSIFYAI